MESPPEGQPEPPAPAAAPAPAPAKETAADEMITEVGLKVWREHWDTCGKCNGEHGCKLTWRFPQFENTIATLWKVARAARRWQQASPGKESCDREDELMRLVDELPPLR